ncbi:hypothetical protein DBV15_06118 [Temnothorax longispinosus]|uniref:Uncharacterized protein n=1 Tax=Temnothorax longispinosus TaxID=300112 RepID=A0A4V3SA03_9HYME|nr:hypothetical protein DBV15_06118 [Temnothorax longispinosus]
MTPYINAYPLNIPRNSPSCHMLFFAENRTKVNVAQMAFPRKKLECQAGWYFRRDDVTRRRYLTLMTLVVSVPRYIYHDVTSVRNVVEIIPRKCASAAAPDGPPRHSSDGEAPRGPLRDSFSLTKPSPSVASLIPYLLFLQGGCDEGSRLRGARVAQAPVEEYRKDAAFLESLIKPAAASNHRRKHRRLQLPARRYTDRFLYIFLRKHANPDEITVRDKLLSPQLKLSARSASFRFKDRKRNEANYNRDEVIDNYRGCKSLAGRRRCDNFGRGGKYTHTLSLSRDKAVCAAGDVVGPRIQRSTSIQLSEYHGQHPRKSSVCPSRQAPRPRFDLALGTRRRDVATTRRTAHGAYPVNEIARARPLHLKRNKGRRKRKKEGRENRRDFWPYPTESNN